MARLHAIFMVSVALLASYAYAGIDLDDGISPRLVKTIELAHPAFLKVATLSGKKGLYISSFEPKLFKRGSVEYIHDISSVVFESSDDVEVTTLANVHWPNEVIPVPENAIPGVQQGAIVCGGFLVPTHTNGAITLIVMNDGDKTAAQTVELSTVKRGFFFHRGYFRDMNGDGRLDILTARATKPVLFGSAYGELLWLEQPAKNALDGHWKEHVIASGDQKGADGNTFSSPDVFFRIGDFDNDNKEDLVASVFFQESLDILWNVNEKDMSGMKLDTTVGPAFAVDIVDINNDGKMELLLSNHMNERDKSSLWAYELVGDARDPKGWKRHTLASGFETIAKGKGQASPGAGIPFFPETADAGKKKPWIALAGDGAMAAYLVTPESEDPSSWEYEVTHLDGATGVVGEIAADDINGDGYTELFVPDYDNSKIYVYTFAP